MYVFNDKQRFIEILRFPFAERASRNYCRDDLRPSFYEINTPFERDEANK